MLRISVVTVLLFIHCITCFKLSSPAFKPSAPIPSNYTCDGENQSPPLVWENLPENTTSLALTLVDMDVPKGVTPFVHWVVSNISSDAPGMVANASLSMGGFVIGRNAFGSSTYQGPCPIGGVHRYMFKLYALRIPVNPSNRFQGDFDLDAFEKALRGLVIDHAQLIGTYARHSSDARRTCIEDGLLAAGS